MESEALPLLWEVSCNVQCIPFGEVVVFAKSEQQEYGRVYPLLSSGESG